MTKETDDKDIFEDFFYKNDLYYSHEERSYLEDQLITYIGNKRRLLPLIGEGIRYCQKRFNKKKMAILDGFSGSGITSRNFKRYSTILYSNDLEFYSYIINLCYLSNKSTVDTLYLTDKISFLNGIKFRTDMGVGLIEKFYAPADDDNIKNGERVFYTNYNAQIIDNIRRTINLDIPSQYHHFFIAPLLSEASIHVNTSGVFKGFYKNSSTGIGQFGGTGRNCLERIKQEISLDVPLFSKHECDIRVTQEDINVFIKDMEPVDIAYFDPPYNQHPYGSNYFMLNIISYYKEPDDISKVSGIPVKWNRSKYNIRIDAEVELASLIEETKAKIILLSYNNEGIIPIPIITDILGKFGDLEILSQKYNAFRGSRNLRERDTEVSEFLFILEKE